MLDAQPSLFHIWRNVVRREHKEVWIRRDARRRRTQDIRIGQTGGEHLRRIQSDASDVDAVLRMDGTEHNRRRAAVVKTEAAAHNRFLVWRITKPCSRTEIVFVLGTDAGVDAVGQAQRIRISDRRASKSL